MLFSLNWLDKKALRYLIKFLNTELSNNCDLKIIYYLFCNALNLKNNLLWVFPFKTSKFRLILNCMQKVPLPIN